MKWVRTIAGWVLFSWIVVVHLVAVPTLIARATDYPALLAITDAAGEGVRLWATALICGPTLVLWLALGGWRDVANYFAGLFGGKIGQN